MDCKEFNEVLEENLIEDKPLEDLSKEALEHKDTCASCGLIYDDFIRLEKGFAEIKSAPLPEDFHAELMSKIPAKKPYVSPFLRYKKFGALAAAFLIFAVSYAVYDFALKDSYNLASDRAEMAVKESGKEMKMEAVKEEAPELLKEVAEEAKKMDKLEGMEAAPEMEGYADMEGTTNVEDAPAME